MENKENEISMVESSNAYLQQPTIENLQKFLDGLDFLLFHAKSGNRPFLKQAFQHLNKIEKIHNLAVNSNFKHEYYEIIFNRIIKFLIDYLCVENAPYIYYSSIIDNWTLIVESVSPPNLRKSFNSNLQFFTDLIGFLPKIGVYILQFKIISIILSYSMSFHYNKIVYNSLFPTEKLKYLAQKLETNGDLAGREIINYINETSETRLVYSFLAKSGYFNETAILKPADMDFWVDFNLTSQTISFLFDNITYEQSDTEAYICADIKMSIIDKITLKRISEKSLKMNLKLRNKISLTDPNFDASKITDCSLTFDIEKLLNIPQLNNVVDEKNNKKLIVILYHMCKTANTLTINDEICWYVTVNKGEAPASNLSTTTIHSEVQFPKNITNSRLAKIQKVNEIDGQTEIRDRQTLITVSEETPLPQILLQNNDLELKRKFQDETSKNPNEKQKQITETLDEIEQNNKSTQRASQENAQKRIQKPSPEIKKKTQELVFISQKSQEQTVEVPINNKPKNILQTTRLEKSDQCSYTRHGVSSIEVAKSTQNEVVENYLRDLSTYPQSPGEKEVVKPVDQRSTLEDIIEKNTNGITLVSDAEVCEMMVAMFDQKCEEAKKKRSEQFDIVLKEIEQRCNDIEKHCSKTVSQIQGNTTNFYENWKMIEDSASEFKQLEAGFIASTEKLSMVMQIDHKKQILKECIAQILEYISKNVHNYAFKHASTATKLYFQKSNQNN